MKKALYVFITLLIILFIYTFGIYTGIFHKDKIVSELNEYSEDMKIISESILINSDTPVKVNYELFCEFDSNFLKTVKDLKLSQKGISSKMESIFLSLLKDVSFSELRNSSTNNEKTYKKLMDDFIIKVTLDIFKGKEIHFSRLSMSLNVSFLDNKNMQENINASYVVVGK